MQYRLSELEKLTLENLYIKQHNADMQIQIYQIEIEKLKASFSKRFGIKPENFGMVNFQTGEVELKEEFKPVIK
jgi:hypothetical protein